MARSIRAFTLDIGLQPRIDALAGQSLTAKSDVALLFESTASAPPPAEIVLKAVRVKPVKLDTLGLQKSDYLALFDIVKAPMAALRCTPEGYRTAVQRYYTAPTAAATKELNAALRAAQARNRKRNKLAVRDVHKIRQPNLQRPVNTSRVVEALIVLGLSTLDTKIREIRANDRSKGSKRFKVRNCGDAPKIEGKRVDNGARQVTELSTDNGATSQVA